MNTPPRMRAAIIAAPTRCEFIEVPVPEPGPGEVRVRLECCGVCASNLPPWEGRPWFRYPMEPGALGHEGCGRIDAIGTNVEGLRVGDRVAVLSQHAYAEYDLAPAEAVVALPSVLDATPFPGEPLGCAMNVFRRSGIWRGETVAIIGVGFLGALLTQLAADAGACVIALSRRSWALEQALTHGASATITITDQMRTVEAVRELTNGKFCEVVIECTGAQEPLDLAGELTGVRGRLVIAGYHQDGKREVNMQMWNWRGLDVINAHERDPRMYVQGIREAVDAVAKGRLEPSALFTHRLPLTDLPTAFALAQRRPDGFFKALISLS